MKWIMIDGLVAELPIEAETNDVFDVSFGSSHMLQITKENNSYKVTNGVNGYGKNCFKEYQNQKVSILIDEPDSPIKGRGEQPGRQYTHDDVLNLMMGFATQYASYKVTGIPTDISDDAVNFLNDHGKHFTPAQSESQEEQIRLWDEVHGIVRNFEVDKSYNALSQLFTISRKPIK